MSWQNMNDTSGCTCELQIHYKFLKPNLFTCVLAGKRQFSMSYRGPSTVSLSHTCASVEYKALISTFLRLILVNTQLCLLV